VTDIKKILARKSRASLTTFLVRTRAAEARKRKQLAKAEFTVVRQNVKTQEAREHMEQLRKDIGDLEKKRLDAENEERRRNGHPAETSLWG
jgi:hypothetical protein